MVMDPQAAGMTERLAVADAQVILFKVEQFHAACLGGQQHGERAVLGRLDAADGIHDDPETNGAGHWWFSPP